MIWPTSKNNQNKYYSRFTCTPKTGILFLKTGVLFLLFTPVRSSCAEVGTLFLDSLSLRSDVTQLNVPLCLRLAAAAQKCTVSGIVTSLFRWPKYRSFQLRDDIFNSRWIMQSKDLFRKNKLEVFSNLMVFLILAGQHSRRRAEERIGTLYAYREREHFLLEGVSMRQTLSSQQCLFAYLRKPREVVL